MPDSERYLVLATIAHELRGPLAPLRHAADAIRLVAGDRPEVAAPLDVMDRQIRFIEGVISELLESTRVAVGKAALRYETVRVAEVIAKALETCSPGLDGRVQKAEVLLPHALTIEADPVRLQQVLVNLIQNASKFSPSGSRIRIKATAVSGEVLLVVEDDGQGISSELLPNVFNSFSQAGAQVAAGPEQGLGLGLGIVRTLVELHGGTVEARSDGAGHGTAMVVRLPRERSPCAGRP